eukprot:12910523-Prorocentrum_lima.AAC.1
MFLVIDVTIVPFAGCQLILLGSLEELIAAVAKRKARKVLLLLSASESEEVGYNIVKRRLTLEQALSKERM